MVTVTGVTETIEETFLWPEKFQNPLLQIPLDKTQHHVCDSCI